MAVKPISSSGRSAGFTLIEIVLVLAVAGLVLVAVFLAAQGAQKSRRDYQRKDDLARTLAAATSWTANHRGQMPAAQADLDDVVANYLHNLPDPLVGTAYNLRFRAMGSAHSDVPTVGDIYFQAGAWCNRGPNGDPANPNNPIAGDDVSGTKFAVWVGLEAGGQVGGISYCLDNSQ
jgi:prepilin-type N-terminal cleavage/methylation domain-containing protein